MAFWDALLADRLPYDDKLEYSNTTAYVKDDIVIYKGIAYIALKATTGQLPTSDCWMEAPKFTSECYNKFWILHLRYYIALNVLWDSLFLLAEQLIPSRVFSSQSEGRANVANTDFNTYRKGLSARIETALAVMKAYMKAGECFGLSKIIGTDCCSCCGYITCTQQTCVEGPQSAFEYEVA